jgi:hypothetical protein
MAKIDWSRTRGGAAYSNRAREPVGGFKGYEATPDAETYRFFVVGCTSCGHTKTKRLTPAQVRSKRLRCKCGGLGRARSL